MYAVVFPVLMAMSTMALGGGDYNMYARPDEQPNIEDHERVIVACEDEQVEVIQCVVDVQNRMDCVMGCAYPIEEED